MANLTVLLTKTSKDLEDYVQSISPEALDVLFGELWEAVRQIPMYGGSARTAESAGVLEMPRLALQLAVSAKSDNLRAEAHRMMAYVLTANEQYEESLRHYNTAVALWEAQGISAKVARARLGSISALFMTGRYDQAIEEARRADEWFICNNDEDGHARLSVNLGNLYHRLDQHARAIEHHNTAVRLFDKLGNTAALAPCYLNIGDSLSMLDRFDEADEYFEKAEELSRQQNQTALYDQVRYNRAYLSYLRGRYSDAIHGFEDLRHYYNQHGSLRHAALCDLDEAEIYLQLNVTDEALRLAGRAVSGFSELGMKYEEAKARAYLGMGLMHRLNPAEALRTFQQAQRIFEQENNLSWSALVELYRAQAHYQLGRLSEARALGARAHNRFLSLNIPSKRAMALALLTRVCLETGDLPQAKIYADCIEQLLLETPIPLHLFPCYSILGQVAEYRKQLDAAGEFYILAARELEVQRTHLHCDALRVNFFKGKQEVYEALIRLAFRHTDEQHRVVEAYNWCEHAKSRGLMDLLSHHLPVLQPHGDAALLTRINRLHEELNSYYVRSEPDDDKPASHYTPAQIGSKKKELAHSLTELAQADPEYASLQKVSIASVEDVQRVLPPHTALIEYFVARDEVMAFVITRERIVLRRHMCTLNRIQHLHERLRLQTESFMLGDTYVNDHRATLLQGTNRHLQNLHGELIRPLANALNVRHLIIVPHSTLHYLPFHAFYDGAEYLIDRYTISYAPSASVLRYCIERKPVEQAKPLIMGVADDHAPQIAEEIAALRRMVPHANTYFGEAATREVLGAFGGQSDFLHIATHATFRSDNPMFSSLKLADGSLTALDLYSMTCQTNLVTLSGCKSGVTELSGGDELLGLMRGFLYAGARSLLLSLWEVNDRSTASFMTEFYRCWLGGSSKAQSLRQAALLVRQNDPHPYYWAPFYLVGSM
jgi:CHAT domain-containing protein/tetratricopeptide (TPR) repeat protein